MIQLQENQQLFIEEKPAGYNEKYNNLELIRWEKSINDNSWGYYASFKIGAEWIDDKEYLVVTTKQGMNNIDFLKMFMTCFTSDLALDSFTNIYKIDLDKPQISAPALNSVISPLVVIHFLGVINRIKSLKRGYVHHQENIKKVKGHIKLLTNERQNIATKKYNRIFCEYDEYSADIPENRLLKKALLFANTLVGNINHSHPSYPKLKLLLSTALKKFENISDCVNMKSVGQFRSNKLFNDYSEAIRLAKTILRHFDYSIHKTVSSNRKITPFVLDMSLLYEHYVYGLLYEAYLNKIIYQFKGRTGYPDFIYKSHDFKAILDTKYIPKYKKDSIDIYVVRQLSAYSRDLLILKCLGYEDSLEENTPTPSVPCIIIYPEERNNKYNPFNYKSLKELCSTPIQQLSMFYKIGVPIPTL